MLTISFHPHATDAPSEDDKSGLQRAKDKLHSLVQGPSTGRTTAQGRRVEKPGGMHPSGPSGQRDESQHNSKHTNK
ncbi:MAG TPA: hypothetical protein VLJ58_14445 [Ramlibacter sp.]|nr:hypothetical protein [Ramlibacter sp.]